MSLSTPQIVAQLERVLASEPSIAAVAIRAAAREPWPETLSVSGRQFKLLWCPSSLAIREALCNLEQQDPRNAGLVVLTPLATHDIAEDIAARLARARVYQPEGWAIVREMFKAKETDVRLGRFAWMPQCLIDGAAQGPYAPATNGFLGLERAWQEVLQRFLHIPSARPDVVALLHWSLSTNAAAPLDQLPAGARADVIRWLAESAGRAGEMVLGCVEAGLTRDALPLGLVCGVLFAPEGEGEAPLGQAAIRLERYVNNRQIDADVGKAWARAAEQVVQSATPEEAHAALARADDLLLELRVAEFAHLSDLLPAALDQRMRDFAQALSAQVINPNQANLAEVERHADRVLRHRLLQAQKSREERVIMALRLARWLATAPASVPTLSSAVAWQADEGAFVDWARFRLLGGDEIAEVSEAYRSCRAALMARRNAFAREFAQALIDWNTNDPRVDGRLVPVERVLEHVVAPIAATHPTLLLVMDGLSVSIYRELFSRSASLGWAEMVPKQLGQPFVGVAALPTITEVSRTSLLCGRLTLGAAAQERAGFASHAALLAHSRAGVPPRLFHKGDLSDATNLSPEVRAAIADPHQRVIGVVYNAVDDHLSGPDQLHQRWAIEDLRLLLPLLREAREARRVVVITADHGHLLEDGTVQVTRGGASDRWRPGADRCAPHELAVSGGRVVTSTVSNTVICLWEENTRYGARKNGYHGGLSPQEVTVPIAVLVPVGMNLPDWVPALPAQPEWWELQPRPGSGESGTTTRQPVSPGIRRSTRHTGQLQRSNEAALLPAPSLAALEWIDVLLEGSIYVSQKQLAARVAPPDAQMRALLAALCERGGKLSRAALARRLALPEVRLGGMLSAARRILNVDQAPVLVVDEGTATVELNIALLQQQFRVSDPGSRR
jgi:hypothetical protein